MSVLKPACAALGFLTVIPLPKGCRHTKADLIRSVPFFPLVGFLIGLSAVGIAFVADGLFPPPVLAVLLVGWLAIVHGGLHLDGLADTADGFLSHHTRERVLDIMRDSRIGTFGCLAMGGGLTFKVAALASLPEEYRLQAILLAPLAARCMMVPMLDFLPPARLDGMGRVFYRCVYQDRASWRSIVEFLGAMAVLLGAGWLFAGTVGLVVGVVVMTATALFGSWCRRRIGGRTGDTVGAAGEIVEVLVLMVFSA
uniref:Adenosylcobinamide-GDP ribazoletransferase n=1 Tax=Candidatus Kentrum eta TaxID=2126337 RepID=A0A450V8X1_9GAMM|nr:MAG: cobalamin-5'-phosphate synthase [Candidatus Kentron sp. H]VFJ94351.1 MAG: cobalamin-5'-phosphate synthase [Candidatus Kentron sp. H]VFK01157.1 MAG: cobalamin-5'-phosphate synthase [Candidatus Kentron sp. H]